MAVNCTVYLRKGDNSGREHVDRALKRLKVKIEKKRAFENAAQVKKRKAKKLTKTWKFMKAEARNKQQSE
jgi:hypothetical protein